MSDLAWILASYLRTRQRRFVDRAHLEAWQARRLRGVLRRAARRFPAYRGLPARLESFPVLGKAELLDRFAELNAIGIGLEEARELARLDERPAGSRMPGDSPPRDRSRRRFAFGLSSGTSGAPGVFLVSRRERCRWAGILLARALPRGLAAGTRVALFLRAGNPLYETIGSRRVAFAFFDLRRPLSDLLPELERFRPTVLVAPARVLRLAAEARAAGDLEVDPERVVSVAEVLDPDDERRIGQVFRLPVHQIYQAAEGFLGLTCPEGRIHLNEDLLVFEEEVLDPGSGRFTPVVTDLWRTSQAIVRCRLGDVLVDDPSPCPCGSAFRTIARIEGRCDDVLVLPAVAGGAVPVFPDLLVRAAFAAAPDLADLRCRLVAPDRIELAVRAAPGGSGADLVAGEVGRAIAAECRRSGAREPEVVRTRWVDEPLAVKRRRVRSDVETDWSVLAPQRR